MRKSQLIAIASISSAIAIILSVISHFWGFATASIGLMASMATALPLILYDNLKGTVLSYVVTSFVLILVINVYAIGYILFFGLYPLVISLTLKIPSNILRYIIKILYYAILLWIFYAVVDEFVQISAIDKLKEQSLFLVYMIGGIVILIIYDSLWLLLFKMLKSRFKDLDV